MPFSITITLSSILGTPGPYNLYSNTDSYVTPFETGVSASGGVITSTNVPNGTTSVKIKSTGGCTYEITKTISGVPTTPTPTPTVTPTPTPTETSVVYNYYQYDVTRSGIPGAEGGYFTYIDINGATQTILQNSYGYVGRYCMRENSYMNNQWNLYTISQVGVCGPSGEVTPDTGFTNANLSYGTTQGCTTDYDHTDGTVQFTNVTKGIGSDVSAPYTIWLSGQTETGWTLVASGISEGGSSPLISNLKSDNQPSTYYYVYDVKVVDTNGKTKISPSGLIFSCATEPPITFTVTTGCTNYEGTGTLTVDITGGGTGTGYYWKIISGPTGFPTGNQTDGGTVSNLADGNYAILIGDSSGDKISTNEDYNINCPPPPNITLSVGFIESALTPTHSTCSSATQITIDTLSPTGTFCNFSNITSTAFTTKTQGNNYWLCYQGEYRRIYLSGNGNDDGQAAGSCVTIT